MLSRPSNSGIESLTDQEHELEWDTQLGRQIARNVIRLRRLRRMSQASVGRAMGTSQSKIARIESGEENITRDTLERLIKALGGRVFISMPPAEMDVPKPVQWWKLLASEPWTVVAVLGRQTENSDQAIVALERQHSQGTPTSDVLIAETLEGTDG